MRAYSTQYTVAEVKQSNRIYQVVAQNSIFTDEVTHLQLLIDGRKVWFPIAQLRATL